jgi:hypothetical protein
LVLTLLELIHAQASLIAQLQDEITRLKGLKTRPTLRPNTLEKSPPPSSAHGRRRGARRSKTAQLTIHETCVIAPGDLPPGSTFKGYQDYVVQDLRIQPHHTRYRLERWQTPTGDFCIGQLPADVRAGGHFGPTLKAFLLDQYYRQRVTQPRLLDQLRSWGVDLSAGQLNRLLIEGHERFHQEKDALLPAGLARARYVHTDDTGARHQGQNGYCTHVGNEAFAWFASTASKSRINFLQLLRGERTDYVLSAAACDYLQERAFPRRLLQALQEQVPRQFATVAAWEAYLDALGVTSVDSRRLATEAALLGSVLAQGVSPELVIVSDDAGQFQVLRNARCWIHAERAFDQLLALTPEQQAAVAQVRAQFWELYRDLKAYGAAPQPEQKAVLTARFEGLVGQETCYHRLNLVLQQLGRDQTELLRVLEDPEIPLHNNLSERDLRDYVIWRKVSGGTRADLGRRCRDTFTSLYKTCRKLGVSFWDYLRDRLAPQAVLAPLAEQVRLKAMPSG